MGIKLDKIDKKLLSYAFHNFRKPLTTISKKCRISREQTEYRLGKYEKLGIIKGYFTIFNLHSLGYKKNHIIRLRVKNPDTQKINFLAKNEEAIIFTKMRCFGEWDFILTIFTKERLGILNFLSKIYDELGEDLLDYDLFEPLEIHYFPLKIFGYLGEDESLGLKEGRELKIDELDKKIIGNLSNKANIRIVDLSKKVNENVETTNYRLKKLEKSLILGYRMHLDLGKMGYNLAQVITKFKSLSKKNLTKLYNYAKAEKGIHAYSIGAGRFNVIYQIIYKNPEDLGREINKIKNEFSDNLIEYRIVNVEEELAPQTV